MTRLNLCEPSNPIAIVSANRTAIRKNTFIALAWFVLALLPALANAQTYSVLYTFTGGKDGNTPGTLLNANGAFYGATSAGGSANFGTIFKVTSAGSKTNVYTFQQIVNGKSPNSPLVRVGNNFYGTTSYGGNLSCNLAFNQFGCGVVFQLSPAGVEKVLHKFSGASDGALPFGGLVADSQGNLYGTTEVGGSSTECSNSGCGTVFKITTAGVETILYRFTGGADGSNPRGNLVVDGQGNVYGTTSGGGNLPCLRNQFGCGVVFKVDASGNETVLHAFRGGTDGAYPASGLVLDSAGNLYGTASQGGDTSCDASGNGCGVVFKIDPSGSETVLYTFQFTDALGSYVSNLILDSAGNLYGTTEYGGVDQDGSIFEVSNTGVFSVLYAFSGSANGEFPVAGLVRDSTGKLFGTTGSGGEGGCDDSLGCGLVFEFTP
jgi:uncharacterized repeat protein (TIGR03803 family)